MFTFSPISISFSILFPSGPPLKKLGNNIQEIAICFHCIHYYSSAILFSAGKYVQYTQTNTMCMSVSSSDTQPQQAPEGRNIHLTAHVRPARPAHQTFDCPRHARPAHHTLDYPRQARPPGASNIRLPSARPKRNGSMKMKTIVLFHITTKEVPYD